MIWPFTKLKSLQNELAEAKRLLVLRDKNFGLLHTQLNDLTSKNEYLSNWGKDLDRALIKACADLETERMRLVACGVGAMANTRESASKQRVGKDSPYYNASVQDVYNAVDREMAVRELLEVANDRAFRASEAHVVTMGNFTQALDRLEDMLKADDGQAWKEAEKFVLRHRGTKVCIKCGSEMIPMHSEDKKLCSNGACGHEVEWKLSEGQQYQYKRNVEPFVEDRSGKSEEPPRSTLERL